VADKIPDAILKAMEGRAGDSTDWAMLSGYVARMVQEGSKDAVPILEYMHELKPSTRIFTGTVAELQSGERGWGEV